jgi:hypothetical protein
MRIEGLTYNNVLTQGVKRRAWLREHSPEHLEQCQELMLRALARRGPATSPATLVLGAGACTEVPLESLARASDEVLLVDLDLASLKQGRAELSAQGLRRRIQPVQEDLSGGVSKSLYELLSALPWRTLVDRGGEALFSALADCLNACPVPDPPQLPELAPGTFGTVISSLVLTQLFGYPLLDVLDEVQRVAPRLLGEQERHRAYQDAAQHFRLRVIRAHLSLLKQLADAGGTLVLLSDVRGFVFNVSGTDHDASHRRAIPLVPHAFFQLVRETFQVLEERRWEWLSDLPEGERPGRGYEVVGYLLSR